MKFETCRFQNPFSLWLVLCFHTDGLEEVLVITNKHCRYRRQHSAASGAPAHPVWRLLEDRLSTYTVCTGYEQGGRDTCQVWSFFRYICFAISIKCQALGLLVCHRGGLIWGDSECFQYYTRFFSIKTCKKLKLLPEYLKYLKFYLGLNDSCPTSIS